MPEKNKFTIIGGPDELGLYTAFDDNGYFHLKEDAETPLYDERYEDIEGFYEGVAVVQQDGKGFHILPDGKPAYSQRYDGVVMRFRNGKADVYAYPSNFLLIKSGSVIQEVRLKEK
jgi:hypothetical protein